MTWKEIEVEQEAWRTINAMFATKIKLIKALEKELAEKDKQLAEKDQKLEEQRRLIEELEKKLKLKQGLTSL